MAEETGNERQLVVFQLADENYGVNIHDVREIIRTQAVTKIPAAPEHVLGVIDLRGNVIPVIDLRRRLSLEAREANDENRIVVVEAHGHQVGVLVDAVQEVLRIGEDRVEATSTIVTTAESYYIEGIAKLEESLLILLDIERALDQDSEILSDASRGTEASAELSAEEPALVA
jgi:purine-binding chemotaxis protein CheW